MSAEEPRANDLAQWWDEFRTATHFLTRLPLGPLAPAMAAPLAQAAWAFPLVGVVVGLLGGFAYALAIWIGMPALPAALLAIGVTALVTGGLHEDGFADTLDGIGGGSDRDAKLAIMRDSRSGAYGVLALVFSVGLRAAALAAIGRGGMATAALVAAHAMARGFLPLAMRALDPARSDGLGAEAGRPSAAGAWGAAALGALIALFALDILPGVGAILVTAGAATFVADLARRQLGGYTGDVLGAIEQGGEITMLLAAASWAM